MRRLKYLGWVLGAIAVLALLVVSTKWTLRIFAPLLWMKTDQAFESGHYDWAERYLSALIWLGHDNAEPHILKAWLEWSEAYNFQRECRPYEHKLRTAVQSYRVGQRHHPESWQIWYEEGMMWDAFHQRERGQQCYLESERHGKPITKLNAKLMPVAGTKAPGK